jgi:hypothetical protein
MGKILLLILRIKERSQNSDDNSKTQDILFLVLQL